MIREEKPIVGEYYHVFNRGVEKRQVFEDTADYRRFLKICQWYLNPDPPISFSQRNRLSKTIQLSNLEIADGLVEVIVYCLMPNHFHFLVRVQKENGLETWIQQMINSYTRSFNTRWNRIGSLFQGPYKMVRVASNNQLLQVSRYIHLNPVVATLVRDPHAWIWSSLRETVSPKLKSWINPSIIIDQFSNPNRYQSFVNDHIGYANTIILIKNLLIEID